jgi:hypothetical protein
MTAMGKQVVDAGGVIVEILASHAQVGQNAPPSKTDLDAWITTYKLPVTTVKDPDNLPLQSMTALERREYDFIVDLKTMKIVNFYMGSIIGVGTTSAQTESGKTPACS